MQHSFIVNITIKMTLETAGGKYQKGGTKSGDTKEAT
jgi:hypothetical protein